MKRFFYFAVWLFVLTSCRNSSCKLLPEVEIDPVLVNDSLVMLPPLQIEDLKSHIVFVTPGMEQSLLFLNKTTQKTHPWGRMGSGPDDFTSAVVAGYKDGKLKLYDSNLQKCIEYQLQTADSIQLHRLHEYKYQSDSINLLNLHMMDSGDMIGFVGFGCKDMFVILDKELQLIKTFGTVPVEGLPEKNNLQMYGWFASYKNKLFFASQLTGYLVCFSINANGEVVKKWERMLTEPLYDLQRQKWEKKNQDGFYDIAVNDKYVFTAFSGKNVENDKKVVPQNILVFTHDGELVKNIKMRDATVGKIAVSDDESRIYMMGSGVLMYYDFIDLGL